MNFYELELLGLKRELPIIAVGRRTKLARFSLLGDVELVNALADEWAKRLKKYKFDCLVAPEVSVLPLVHGVALRLGHKRFVVCRKNIRPYMISPVEIKPLAHFPKHVEPLVISGQDAEYLKGKKVAIFDDVVSTGVTMRMVGKLIEKVGAEVVLRIAVLRQGEQFDKMENFLYLGELPIFHNE